MTLYAGPLLLFATLAFAGSLSAATPDNAIRLRIEDGRKTELLVADAPVAALPGLRRFYEARAFQPAWTDEEGRLNAAAEELMGEIRHSREEGLNPDDYHLATLERLTAGPLSAGGRTDLELLLSDGWLVLASHYLSGRVDPVTIDPEWVPSRRNDNLPARLAEALERGRTAAALREMLPQQAGYGRLRVLLAAYRARGDLPAVPPVPPGNLIKPGSSDPRVPALRRRLGGEVHGDEEETRYDEGLAASVRAFQESHGLEPDGIVGPTTLRELNSGPGERIDRILANLERWRWMPATLGPRHVKINIAGFRLEAWENDALARSMKVIVGRSYRRTPLFSDNIRYLVFNPAWEVPPNIAIQDKLPQLRKDPESMQRAGFVVLSGQGADEVELDLRDIDWKSVDKSNFRYRLRQKPGPGNALGRVKIMFPNRFNVYLHDTSNPELFAKNVRTFSSGCIRLQEPQTLAQWLLEANPDWPEEKVVNAMTGDLTQTVVLSRPVPLHLQYWTAWVDDAGEAHFIDDIYQRGAPLAAALRDGIRR